MKKELIFISYSSEDDNKKRTLLNAINKSSRYEGYVVAKKKQPGTPLTTKVKEGIEKSKIIVAILTRKSYKTQWVNQEIGYAIANNKKIIPLIEKQILSELRGFVHDKDDNPFTFKGNRNDKRKEANYFRKCRQELIDYLINYDELPESKYKSNVKTFKANVQPLIVKKGDEFFTEVQFNGSLKNGFFDNYIQHSESSFSTWNVDPSSLDNMLDTTPGNLKGHIKSKHRWFCDTSEFPLGEFKVYVRVYDHPTPGKPGRHIVTEKVFVIKVVNEIKPGKSGFADPSPLFD